MSRGLPKTLVALLEPGLAVEHQVRWATRLAAARKLDLLILQRLESSDDRIVELPLGTTPKGEPADVIHAITRIIEEARGLRAGPRESTDAGGRAESTEPHIVHVCLKVLHFTNLAALRRAVLTELGRSGVGLFTVARRQLVDMTDLDLVRERRKLLRYIPCEMVLCHGFEKDNAVSRVLVATARGPNEEAAVRLGVDLTTSVNGALTAVYVNPAVGVDADRVGERRLGRRLDKALGTGQPALSRRVVVDDQVHRGIRRVWDEGGHDLVVVGAPRGQLEGSLCTRLGKGIPVVVVKAAAPVANRLKQFVEESIQWIVPQIERDDRVALVDRLQSSAAWNFDFLALMVLSTTMAAIGLIQNSAAVVIGAMLVAPLMTPLLGLGLALVQGNPVLARLSLRSITFGLGVSLLGGFLVGLFTPGLEEPTREMLARGGPGLLDLVVAFAGGLAAAYASSRPGLVAALPGVAIATALVPPIATSGLALSLGDFPLALGAVVLFGINMVTIVLASMASLWAVGLRNLKKTSRWTMVAGGLVIAAVLALGVHLSLKPTLYELTDELPEGLVGAVQERLGANYRLDSLAVAYDELGVQLHLQVVGKTPAPEELATEVRAVASDHYQQPVRVRMLTRIEIDVAPAE